MKRILSIVVALAALAPFSANAADARMSDARYLAASRCLAYADLPELRSDPGNFSALRAAAALGFRSSSVASDARDNAARIRATARRLSNMETGPQQLREERSAACAGFVAGGLVQLEASSAPS
ncbi:MAG: hypothetical protein WAU68_11260 [Vitreimonas sp.]